MNLTMPQILIVRYKEIVNFTNMNKTNNCLHMKNPAQTGSGCIRFNDLNFHEATFAEYSCPIRLRGAR
jgi:hypothetical protein